MTEPLVTYEAQGPAAVITMNRADRRNALCRPLIIELTEAFECAVADSAARCVLLTGAGPSYCAGMDLAELAETINKSETVWEDALRLAKLFDLIYTLPKPTIAVVRGAAVAGGAGLVSVCDLAIAEPGARIGYPEVRRGLVAAMVLPHLLRHVGERAAHHLLLTGDLIDAEEGLRIGLINRVVPLEQLFPAALEWAAALAQGGPLALAKTKSLLRRFSRQAMSPEEAAEASAAPRLTEECQQGLTAFFEKRPAPWVPQRE